SVSQSIAPAPVTPQKSAHKVPLPPPPDRVRSAFAKVLDFHEGEPVVPVGVMEGQREVTFSSAGRLKLVLGGAPEKTVSAAPATVWRVRTLSSHPAKLKFFVELEELKFNDNDGLQRALALWGQRGVPVRARPLGSVYGIAGKVLDNRRTLV